MKKISLISALLALCILVISVPFDVSAAEEIDFVPELKSGRLYGISLKSTESAVRSAYYDKTVEIKDRDGNTVSEGDSSYIGTGFTVKINGVYYPTVVMGDVTGDGMLTAVDYLMTKRAVIGATEMGSLSMEAAGASNGKLRPIHYIMIKRACFGTYDINHQYSCDPYVPEDEVSDTTSSVPDISDDWN